MICVNSRNLIVWLAVQKRLLDRDERKVLPVCRNIKSLFNVEPPVTEEEIRAAALQFVRKVSGFYKPSKINEAAFIAAVDGVATVSRRLLNLLQTNAMPRNRTAGAAKSRAHAAKRFPTK